ncbi:MAG: hypothetical protein KAQ79_17425, partial [Cyclobacteriaceae bacterium]|nr:hypothetical protein [Cyclobacteriaceae bacterium]
VRFRYAPHKGLRVVNDQEMIKFAALFSFVQTIVHKLYTCKRTNYRIHIKHTTNILVIQLNR